MRLEGKLAEFEIQVFRQKLENKYNKIDERFLLLNEAKYKLSE
jgi:hypothetical protein